MKHISVKIINDSPYALPAYETHSAAGMDVRANISEPLTLGRSSVASYPQGCAYSSPKATNVRYAPAPDWL